MFFAEAQIRVHLYGQPTDMRKSYDGLQALARHAMSRDPLDGALYIFVNRRGSQIKCLYFDRSGFCIWGKRLESGRFISDWRDVRTREILQSCPQVDQCHSQSGRHSYRLQAGANVLSGGAAREV
jgi:transposase